MFKMKVVWFSILLTFGFCLPAISNDYAWLYQGFSEPKPEFSPVPIWWWSGGKVTKEGITWQLQELVKGGIYNAIILNLAPSGPLYGSYADDPLFLTEEWWDLFAHTLKVAKSLGVRIWFYDQLGFSGAGLQARVVKDHPEFRGISLKWVVQEVNGPGIFEVSVPPDATSPLALFMAKKVEVSTSESQGSPKWIWGGTDTENIPTVFFRKSFDLAQVPKKAEITITCDNGYELYVNGKRVGGEILYDPDGWEGAEIFDVLPFLITGKNVIAVRGTNLGGPGGLVLNFVSDILRFASDGSFKVSMKEESGWVEIGFDDSGWKNAKEIAELGGGPWGSIRNLNIRIEKEPLGPKVEDVTRMPIDTSQRTYSVNVPEGRYELQLFYTVPGGFDYHNPSACHALLNMLHYEIERRFPDELGKTIAGSFQDEFPPTPRFSKLFLEEFPKRKGYDIVDYLPALIRDVVSWSGKNSAPSTVKVRCDSADVASSLAEEAFFIPLEQWHEKYGMLCGYDQTVRNADPFRGEEYYVDYFKTMRHYSAPGNDMDGDCKPHQSIADLYNKPRVWIEAFHSSGWGQTIEEIATLLHPWVLNGATLFDPHAIYYSIHGSYWEWAPPDTGWRQPYFVHYKVLSDYVARMCWLLTQGKHKVEVGLLHPATTTHAYISYQINLPGAKRVADAYWNVQKFLRQHHIDYIILDEDSVARGEVQDNNLVINEIYLRVLILPSAEFIRSTTVEKLGRYAQSGGLLFVYGNYPSIISDIVDLTPELEQLLKMVQEKSQIITNLDEWAKGLRQTVAVSTVESLPVLERDVNGKPVYFVMSDEGTPATSRARFDINKRALYDIPSARGEPIVCTLTREGVPEFWNALTGQVETVWNYSIDRGKTKTMVDLTRTPAPLISLRPRTDWEPDAVESDLHIVECKYDNGIYSIVAEPFLGKLNIADERKTIKLRKDDKELTTEVQVPAVEARTFEGPFDFSLIPTCDNKDGSFAYPPSSGPIPVETRAFKGVEEITEGDTSTDWLSPDYDDSGWEMMIASFGPRARWKGPVSLPPNTTFDSLDRVVETEGNWNESEYSLKLGINEDPVFSSALGGKGRIPEEFIDLGRVKKGQVFHIQCYIELPYESTDRLDGILAKLRVGAIAKKKVFFNKIPINPGDVGMEKVLVREVKIVPGVNVIDIFLESIIDDRLRLYFHFLPAEVEIQTPEWIWSAERSPTGRTRFVRIFNLPEKPISAIMVVALGDVHQIFINGVKVADQGNFDPYFTSRAEQYNIVDFVQAGDNKIEIIARDVDSATGLLLDCYIQFGNGKDMFVVSDSQFAYKPDGEGEFSVKPVQLLPKPSHGYMGDPALLLVKQRPHPLPYAGWLQDQPEPPAPFNKLVYFPDIKQLKAYRFRFLVPPGAREMLIKSVSQPEVWINGESVTVEKIGEGYKVVLPTPESPRRIACMRVNAVRGYAKGALILEPITYTMGDGKIPLGSWDELGFLHYCGGIEYRLSLEGNIPSDRKVILNLGRVRGTAEVFVNGISCGKRVWHPYVFDITSALTQSVNDVRVRVFNTLGPHFAIGHPSAHVFENHTKSGIYGPVKVLYLPVVKVGLS